MNNKSQNYNPFISIIIPVYNSSRTIRECLESLNESAYTNFEIIVVNDWSNDESVKIAEEYNCKIINLEKNCGANTARNRGAESATGEILLFIDSDVVIKENTIVNIVKRMRNKNIGSVVGVYAWELRNEGFISQYKNLWIRYSYIKSPPDIDWIFGAISAIRREIFFEIGGFNFQLIARDGNDDIDLGKRFSNLGYHIFLDPKVEVFHLKQFTFFSLLKNEFYRSVGFAKLAASIGETTTSLGKGFVNVYPAFIAGTFYSFFLLSCFVLYFIIPFNPWYFIAGILLFIGINVKFLNFFEQTRGFFAMITVIPVLYLDQLTCFIGAVIGTLKGFFKKNNETIKKYN